MYSDKPFRARTSRASLWPRGMLLVGAVLEEVVGVGSKGANDERRWMVGEKRECKTYDS